MSPWQRWLRFNGVGAMGIVVQLIALVALARMGLPYQAATPLAVAAAVLHNFAWHRLWTWPTQQSTLRGFLATFVRFGLANGAVSLMGNAALMPVLVSVIGLPIVPANLAAVFVCGLLNYWLAGIVVFGPTRQATSRAALSPLLARASTHTLPAGPVARHSSVRMSRCTSRAFHH